MPVESSSEPAKEVSRALAERLKNCWRLKAAMSVALPALFCVPYFLIGNFPLVRVHTMTLSPIDRAIGFHPAAWVWVYQSLYFFTTIVPWLAETRAELWRFIYGLAILSFVSFAIFLVYPIRSPKPVIDESTGMYWILQQYDPPLNSLPSLHAGLLVYTLAFGRRIVERLLPAWFRLFCAIWAVLILYGTLATKQHFFIDVVAGAALALIANAWAWRQAAATIPTHTPLAEPLPAES